TALVGHAQAAVGRAQRFRLGAPAAAADDAHLAADGVDSASVAGCAGIRVLPAVLGPLPRVAGQVVEAERIRLELPDRRERRESVVARLVARRQGLVLLDAREIGAVGVLALAAAIVAPVARGAGAGAGRVFPLRLRGEAVMPARRLRQP